MKITPHRGTHQIGGTCIELQSGDTRIVVDIGIPLTDVSGKRYDFGQFKGLSGPELVEKDVLPSVKGLYSWDKHSRPVDAVFISHSHKDHYGFLPYVSKSIPVYMSEGCKKLLGVAYYFGQSDYDPEDAVVIKSWEEFKAGDFTVTPYLVDHSAVDAFAYLVEAGGKKVFYSGDFRGHGRKSVLFKRMISNPPEDIDTLLMEGSMIGRGNQAYKDENAIQSRIEKILKSSNNISFLFTSSQNIDRLVSAYKACIKTEHIFVIDIYTAYILDKLRKVSKGIPQFNWRNIKVKFLKHQADTLAKKVSTKLLYHYNTQKIDIFEINRKKNKILMLARDNSIFPKTIKGIDNPRGATVIYSMWGGYLNDRFRDFCANKGLTIEQVHTSGHATAEDLKAFAKAISPKTLIPIHTFEGKQYPEMFENVRILKDGELFKV